MRFTLTEDERHLIALRRAVVEYSRERSRWDAGKEEPEDEDVYLQLGSDLAGSLWVEPGGSDPFRVLVWHALGPCLCKDCKGDTAAERVERARSALEEQRLERDTFGNRRISRRRAS